MFGRRRTTTPQPELPEDQQVIADFVDGEHRAEGSTELTFDLKFDDVDDEGTTLVMAASGPEVGGSWGINRSRSVARMKQAMVEWHRLLRLERDLLPPPWVWGDSILEMRRLYRRLWPDGPGHLADDASVPVELVREIRPGEGWYLGLKESGDGRAYAVLPPGLPVRGPSGEADTRRVLAQWEAWVIDYHCDPDAPPWEEFPGESAEDVLVNFPGSVAEAFRERIARDGQAVA